MSYKVFVEMQTECMGVPFTEAGYLMPHENGVFEISNLEEKALIFDDWESAYDMCVRIENKMSDSLVCCTVVS